MEFGIFIQGFVPEYRRREDPDAEHRALMNDIECVLAADRAGFKYVWVTEHHFLDEYSHLSANDTVLAYLAHATERIHLGSGIFNPLPQVNHPAKVAERVAMLDHLTGGRFEFGTGRGAGSHEILAFLPDMTDLSKTREIWEDVIAEFPKMWLQDEYEGYEGTYWSMPPRKVLPKPWKKPHPPMWRAAGNPPTYAESARQGLGVLGFNVASVKDMEPMVTAYKDNIANAEPVGDYVNDNVMITNGVVCLEDGKRAREVATNMGLSYLQSLVFYYHDTFPKQEGFPVWPEPSPEPTLEEIEFRISEGYLLCGDPDEVTEQVRRYQAVGCDQVAFGLPVGLPQPLAVETLRLFGQEVIPKFDQDSVHRSTHMRMGERALTE